MSDKVMDALDAAESALQSLQLKVGFIDGAIYPDGTPVALVAATNEYGRPENNQPPRPFFRDAIAEHESEWGEKIADGIKDGVPVDQVLSAVGEVIVADVRKSIATLMDPPLSPATIHHRRTRKKLQNDSTKPLVDTKEMIRDVHYEVGEIEHSEPGE
ncbi:hypothetical protein [Edwardsiella tarda]|uniref:hypothetical protein n=1 Tax=Edwardsiella tarda TaxID=636 RepID=UPI000554347C|nr:hypothetical protein [Edwardsiella tarda]